MFLHLLLGYEGRCCHQCSVYEGNEGRERVIGWWHCYSYYVEDERVAWGRDVVQGVGKRETQNFHLYGVHDLLVKLKVARRYTSPRRLPTIQEQVDLFVCYSDVTKNGRFGDLYE